MYDTIWKDTVAPFFRGIEDAGDGNYKDDEYITFNVDMDETGLTVTANLFVLDSAFSSNQALAYVDNGIYSFTTGKLDNPGEMAEGTAIAVEFTATDSAGHITTNDAFTLELDKTPPGGLFKISVDYTQSVSVSLSMIILGASEMRFGNSESERNEAGWEKYNGTKSWTLESTSQVGARTVYAEFRDAAGNTSTESDDTLFVKKLTASAGASGDYFGCSAGVSSNGDTVISGAYGDNSDQGTAYIYNGTIWGSETVFTDTVYGGPGDRFGYSVGISGSGSVVAIGAYGDDSNRGHVWVRYSTDWGSAVRLTHGGTAGDFFGNSVAISGDGSVVVAGAPGDDTKASDAGAVYGNYGTLWGSYIKLTAGDGAVEDYFGSSIAVSADGSVVVTGVSKDDDSGDSSGSVYVYSGTDWATETKLTASDAAASDNFGFGVAVSADGSTVVAGAYGDDDNGSSSGSVYVYTGTNWATETKLTASDGASSDYFGRCVSVSSDGSVIAVGAHGDDDKGSESGSVYVYSGTNWATEVKLTAFDGAESDTFGKSVSISISSTGSIVVIGAPGVDTNEGVVYLLPPVTVPW